MVPWKRTGSCHLLSTSHLDESWGPQALPGSLGQSAFGTKVDLIGEYQPHQEECFH
jgi:hypothetical protein